MVSDFDVWGDAIHHSEPQRLHSMKPDTPTIKTEGDQLIQPRHQQAGMMLIETNDLRCLGECLLDESRCVEPVAQNGSVLPEGLVDHIVRIRIDRGDRDVAFGLGTAQYVRPEHDHVTGSYRFLSELAE